MELAAGAARHLSLIVACALVIGLIAWRGTGDPVTSRLEGALLDLRFQLRGPLPAPENVVIVAIDERAVNETGGTAQLRAALAEALSTISAARPRVIAVDILLADTTGADRELAAAIEDAGRVLLGVATTASPAPSADPGPEQDAALSRSALPVTIGAGSMPAGTPGRLILPNAALASAGRLAHVNITAGPDAAARAYPLTIPVGEGRLLPSMALSAARIGQGISRDDTVYWVGGQYRMGARTIVPDRRGRLVLDHYGGAGTIRTHSLRDVLAERVAPEVLSGRVVFVGSTAPSLRDEFATPFGATVPGVEILATAAANILEEREVRRDRVSFILTAVVCLGAVVLVPAALLVRRLTLAVAGALAVWGASAGALQLAFQEAGLWLDGATVLGGLSVGTALGAWKRLSLEQRRGTNLAHYVPPSLARHLAESARPSFDGREMTAGIVFVDVAGYSGMVEALPPSETATFTRDLHRFFEEAVERHHGLILDYQGDGALLAFGVPEPGPDDAANALGCARMLVSERHRVRPGFLSRPVSLRASVHWGPVAVAVLGGRRHAQISVAGDAVNVASRLQESAKAHGVPLVASRAVLDAAGGAPGFRPLGREPLRGRVSDIEIWGRDAEEPA